MALNSTQWYQKLVKFVPSWWFEKIQYSVAIFQGIAAVFAAVDKDAADQLAATFITQATTPVLDNLGDERSVSRIAGESDGLYAPRIQQITSHTDKASIKAAIDAKLLTGTSTILEAPANSLYCSRAVFLNRPNYYLLDYRRNYFLVVIPPQVHAPYSFLSRSYFASRSNFVGSVDSTPNIFSSIVATVNQLKAFGVMYGVLETSS